MKEPQCLPTPAAPPSSEQGLTSPCPKAGELLHCPRQETRCSRAGKGDLLLLTFLDPWHMMTQRPSSSCSGRLAWPTICSTS